MSDLPVIKYGTAHSAEHEAAVTRGTQQIIAILNDLPIGAMLPTLCSVVASMCASQRDPADYLSMIGVTAALTLDRFEAMPVAGSA